MFSTSTDSLTKLAQGIAKLVISAALPMVRLNYVPRRTCSRPQYATYGIRVL